MVVAEHWTQRVAAAVAAPRTSPPLHELRVGMQAAGLGAAAHCRRPWPACWAARAGRGARSWREAAAEMWAPLVAGSHREEAEAAAHSSGRANFLQRARWALRDGRLLASRAAIAGSGPDCHLSGAATRGAAVGGDFAVRSRGSCVRSTPVMPQRGGPAVGGGRLGPRMPVGWRSASRCRRPPRGPR